MTQYRLKRPDDAITSFAASVACNPQFFPADRALGDAYLEKGDDNRALAAYEAALKIQPDDPDILWAAGHLCLKHELNQRATALVERSVQLQPGDPEAKADLGAVYGATGEMEKAERQFRDALALNSQLPSAMLGLGALYLKTNRNQEALPLLQEAARLAPQEAKPFYLLGSAFNRLGRYTEAAAALEQAASRSSEDADVYYQLAHAYGHLHRTAEGQKALERFTQIRASGEKFSESRREAARLAKGIRPIVDQKNIAIALQVTSITSSPSDSLHPAALATMTYTPWGALQTLQNSCVGTGCLQRKETYTYNNRLQPVLMQLGTNQSGHQADNSCLVYNYYAAGVSNPPASCGIPGQGQQNNGNVMGYYYLDQLNSSVSNTATNAYDALNRLSTATAKTLGGSTLCSQTYQFDRWGNMWCAQGSSGLCTNKNISYAPNTLTNRITASGYTYDAAGNLTQDAGFIPNATYTWDAEGRLTSSTSNGQTSIYTYDARGYLAEEYIGSLAAYKEHFYDAYGRRVGKHNRTNWDYHLFPLGGRTIAKFNNAPDTLFVHADALGSSTFVMDHFGNPLQDQTFYPWGTTWNAVPNSVDGTFASIIPRDLGVDLFLTPNRDYSSNQGRWLRPDPLAGILRIRSPSTDMRMC